MSGGPDFLVIGAMKSATSSLHDQLAAQPGIFMSDPKEPNFFSDDDRWQRGWGWYEGLFYRGQDALLCGESSTHYTKLPTYPKTVARIYQYLPQARLIYVMRDPVDRLVSQFIHEWTEREMVGEIDEAVKRYPRLIAYSRYAMQLRPYLETFGASRVLPVFFEALRRQPQAEFERIGQFLGYEGDVKWTEDLAARNVSRDRMRRSPWRDRFINQPILAYLRRTVLPEALRERVKNLWRMRERPSLSEAVLAQVENELNRDLAELSVWLGVELNCANFAAVAASINANWTAKTPGFSAQ